MLRTLLMQHVHLMYYFNLLLFINPYFKAIYYFLNNTCIDTIKYFNHWQSDLPSIYFSSFCSYFASKDWSVNITITKLQLKKKKYFLKSILEGTGNIFWSTEYFQLLSTSMRNAGALQLAELISSTLSVPSCYLIHNRIVWKRAIFNVHCGENH